MAREFVRSALAGVAPGVVETAQLLVSELATNAVMHAHTEFEVRVQALEGRIRVQVSDARPRRRPVSRQPFTYAGTGRGLPIVEQLASRYGVQNGEGRKTVWCELWPGGPPPPTSGWEPVVPLSGPTISLTLLDMPRVLHWASHQQRAALLRELMLAVATGSVLGVLPEDLFTAHDMNNVISAGLTTGLEDQPSGADMYSLYVPLPAGATAAVLTLGRLLDLANEAARRGRLLSLPALPQVRAFRHWLLDQIIGQLAGGHPTAWTLVPREPSARPSELAPWDASQVQASRIPTVAADDENRIIAVNGPAASMLGWQTDELVGQRITVLIPEHLRQRHVEAFTSLQLTGEPHILGRSVPLPALHHDGRTVPVRLFIQTQETTDGRTVFVAQLIPRSTETPSVSRAAAGSGAAATAKWSEPLPPAAETARRTGGGGMDDRTALERLSLLAAVTGELTGASDLNDGLRRVGRVLTRRLAEWCVVELVEHDRVNRVCVVHRNPEMLPPEANEGRLPPLSDAAHGSLARVLHGADPLLLTDTSAQGRAESPLDSRQRELFDQLGTGSAIIAPLRVRREILGALTIARTGGEHPFTEEDLPLITDLVRSIALGADNIRLYQETRNIAERLQRSLLPVLPRVAHLEMAARYAPSSTTAQVGGDWYDSFVLPNGQTVLVIGDVAGHDLEAAGAMSALRNMLRGIATDRQEPPGEVLRRLDLANHTQYREATATCIYALVKGPDEGPWELEHSSAGHLPPLLTTRDGDTRYLEDGMGLLLGMDPNTPRTHARDPLPAHSTLLLYTDGLIERRGESLDHAMARLRRKTAALAREPLDVFCDELLIELGADSSDDIAVLALRPTPPR